jgi:hypothetical protein|tara:strand:+ start:124 stop:513 length:390 start_codon:yes stop_codon:yes gene_type:complete
MSRARDLSRFSNPSNISITSDNRVGIASTTPDSGAKLDVTGVVVATAFTGDGTGLTGVASTDNIITGTAATFTGSVNVSGITTVGVLSAFSDVNVSGVVTATSFVGSGQNLTNLPAGGDSLDVTASLFI